MTLRVVYKRTFQHRQFEPQDITLFFEHEFEGKVVGIPTTERDAAKKVLRDLYKDLEAVGDELMVDALVKPDPRRK